MALKKLMKLSCMSAVFKNKLMLCADDSAISVFPKLEKDTELLNRLSVTFPYLGQTESVLFESKQILKCQSSLNDNCNDQII